MELNNRLILWINSPFCRLKMTENERKKSKWIINCNQILIALTFQSVRASVRLEQNKLVVKLVYISAISFVIFVLFINDEVVIR